MERRRNRAATQGDWQFEWPVPDVRNIGNPGHGAILDRDKAAINATLQSKINREKLWDQLEPVIEETRSPKELVETLESAICALETSVQIVTRRNDSATAQAVREHVKVLHEALCYYTEIAKRPEARLRLDMFRILRAWLEAGGKLTVSTPDNPDMMKGERRGRGSPGGPLVDYLQTAFLIICKKKLGPEGIKKFLYRNYRAHSHIQYIDQVRLSGGSGFNM